MYGGQTDEQIMEMNRVWMNQQDAGLYSPDSTSIPNTWYSLLDVAPDDGLVIVRPKQVEPNKKNKDHL